MPMLKRNGCVALALVLTGCGTLPSIDQVEQKFRRDHPTYTIESASYHIEGSRNGLIRNDAVFHIVYRKPGDARSHTYERRFGTVAEGWIEVPSKARDE